MDIQLRSEVNGISHVGTLEEALRNARLDPTIWKISFTIETGERVRLVRAQGEHIFLLQPLLDEVLRIIGSSPRTDAP